ncbi:hypothetical protein ACFQ60_46335 [Streptomyces zhihengii]
MAVDGDGGLFVAEYHNHRVRRITADGIITTFTGTGTAGFTGTAGRPRRPG